MCKVVNPSEYIDSVEEVNETRLALFSKYRSRRHIRSRLWPRSFSMENILYVNIRSISIYIHVNANWHRPFDRDVLNLRIVPSQFFTAQGLARQAALRIRAIPWIGLFNRTWTAFSYREGTNEPHFNCKNMPRLMEKWVSKHTYPTMQNCLTVLHITNGISMQ